MKRLWDFDWWTVRRWFLPRWWHYLLDGSPDWTRFWCRVRDHPCGPVYYNIGGTEPDWRCRNCGENLG